MFCQTPSTSKSINRQHILISSKYSTFLPTPTAYFNSWYPVNKTQSLAMTTSHSDSLWFMHRFHIFWNQNFNIITSIILRNINKINDQHYYFYYRKHNHQFCIIYNSLKKPDKLGKAGNFAFIINTPKVLITYITL